MLIHQLKITWRQLKRHKIFSFINIVGLAVGIAAALLILLWVRDELSFDRFHENRDHIYRVVSDWDEYHWDGFEGSPGPLAPALQEELPGIKAAARIVEQHRKLFSTGGKAFYEDGGILADPEFFQIFSFSFVRGNPETALSGPYDIVVTQSMASRYFGEADPLGKTLEVDGKTSTITGVIDDIPPNSHLKFDYINSYAFIREHSAFGRTWSAFNFMTYLLLQPETDIESIGPAATAIALKNNSSQVKEGVTFRLQPLKKIHLDARPYRRPLYNLGDSRSVHMFSLIAFFILLSACINFINLSTARSTLRSREVGLRKTVGAKRRQLILQFFGESLLFTATATGLALFMLFLLLPAFNRFSGKNLHLELPDTGLILGLPVLILVTGMIAGIYPAVYLSAFKPAASLKSKSEPAGPGTVSRRCLVIIQFAISIMLITGTALVSRQLHFIRNKSLGFRTENIITLPVKQEIAERFAAFKTELLRGAEIRSVAATSYLFTDIVNRTTSYDWDGKDPDVSIDMIINGIDAEYTDTMDLELAAGRTFSHQYPTDKTQAYILNEEAVKRMGMESPLGKSFSWRDRKGTIIGILKDSHFQSLHEKIHPHVFVMLDDLRDHTDYGAVLVRIEGDTTRAMTHIRRVWREVLPGTPFEYRFLDREYERLYRSETRAGAILNYFTALAVFIACLGLFGLAAFTSERRTKEIGIRKILGARPIEITCLLSKDFSKWILLANLIAWPAAYLAVHKWLQNFAYQTNLSVGVFLLSGLAALIIALLATGFYTLKAANADPMRSLRHE